MWQNIGSKDKNVLPKISIGILFHQKLKNLDPNETLLINEIDNSKIKVGNFLKSTENLAKHFLKLGIEKNNIVSIVACNCWEHLAITLALLYIGATVNLLNENYTSGELNHFFKICEPKLIFCSIKTLKNMQKNQELKTKIIITDLHQSNKFLTLFELLKPPENDRYNFVPVQVNPFEDVALILASSGTTGLPKAVMLTHANLRTPLEYFGYSECITFSKSLSGILIAPIFHIYGLTTILSAILYESKLVVIKKFTPDKYLKTIEKYQINTLFIVPSVLLFLVKQPLVNNYDLSSLKTITYGGSSASKSLEKDARKRFPHVQLRQQWGMTETTLSVTIAPENTKYLGSIGQVAPMWEVVVSDEDGNYLGPNMYGELRMKGCGVTKGYFKNEEATTLAFDKNGYLKSGDLGYYNSDGYFFIVGRIKELIKYKAFQVPPAEIEALLVKHDKIKDAAVVGMPDEKCGELPVAFIVKESNYDLSEAEVVEYVKNNISIEKQLRGGVRFIEEIPKNSLGKILRGELKKLLVGNYNI